MLFRQKKGKPAFYSFFKTQGDLCRLTFTDINTMKTQRPSSIFYFSFYRLTGDIKTIRNEVNVKWRWGWHFAILENTMQQS